MPRATAAHWARASLLLLCTCPRVTLPLPVPSVAAPQFLTPVTAHRCSASSPCQEPSHRHAEVGRVSAQVAMQARFLWELGDGNQRCGRDRGRREKEMQTDSRWPEACLGLGAGCEESLYIYIYSHIYIGIGFEESFIYILSFISISKPLKPSNGRNTSGRIVPAQKSCGAPESQPRHDTISMFVPALAL
jgi:hypothetical protein